MRNLSEWKNINANTAKQFNIAQEYIINLKPALNVAKRGLEEVVKKQKKFLLERHEKIKGLAILNAHFFNHFILRNQSLATRFHVSQFYFLFLDFFSSKKQNKRNFHRICPIKRF